MWLMWTTAMALATEVVWVTPRDTAAEVRVASAADASGPPLSLTDLRYADTDWTEADAQALQALDTALSDVREFESRLDGELVIMRELAAPIDAVGVIRNAEDRERLFRALVYQGFAVNRFYAEYLGEDADAAPYRLDSEAGAQVRPWVDALALEPDRSLTPYDVAEAPARIAYQQLKEARSTALPALLVPSSLPEDTALVVDGRPVSVPTGTSLRLMPGRHLAHLERDGHIVARWDLDLAPAERVDLAWSHDDARFAAWTTALSAGEPSPPPASLSEAILAQGGTVVIAMQVDGETRAYTVTPDTAVPLALPSLEPSERETSAGEAGRTVQVELALGGGWLGSPDFYYQDHTAAEPTAQTVNAGVGAASLGLSADVGALRVVGGADLLVPTGENHAARYRDRFMRLRPTPWVGAGLAPAQLVVGYAFPYHPWAGGRLAIPLAGDFELRGVGGFGLGMERTRDDGSTYTTQHLGTAWVGLGTRL